MYRETNICSKVEVVVKVVKVKIFTTITTTLTFTTKQAAFIAKV
jgi:hypothetical protein